MTDFLLQTQRLRIVPFDMRYLEDYTAQFTEEITALQYPDPFPGTEEARAFLSEFLELMDAGEMLELMILTREGRFLGSFEVFGWKGDRAEIGLWLRKDAHGQGYGSEALGAVLEELRRQNRFTACLYEADRRNAASIALVRRFGGRETEVNRITTESGKELELITYEIPL